MGADDCTGSSAMLLSSIFIWSLFPGAASKVAVELPNIGGGAEVEGAAANVNAGLLEAPRDDPKAIGAVLEVENEDEDAPKVKPVGEGEEPKAGDCQPEPKIPTPALLEVIGVDCEQVEELALKVNVPGVALLPALTRLIEEVEVPPGVALMEEGEAVPLKPNPVVVTLVEEGATELPPKLKTAAVALLEEEATELLPKLNTPGVAPLKEASVSVSGGDAVELAPNLNVKGAAAVEEGAEELEPKENTLEITALLEPVRLLSDEAVEVGPNIAPEEKGVVDELVEPNDVSPEVPEARADIDEPNWVVVICCNPVALPNPGRDGFVLSTEPPALNTVL